MGDLCGREEVCLHDGAVLNARAAWGAPAGDGPVGTEPCAAGCVHLCGAAAPVVAGRAGTRQRGGAEQAAG